MHKRVGANRRRKHGEKRQAAGKALGRMAARLASAGKIAAVALLVCGGGIAAAMKLVPWINRSPMFTVKTVLVEGCMRVDKAEVLRQSGLTRGMRMMQIRPAAAQKAIEQNAWVRHARVLRRFPNTVVVRLEERVPIALVNCGRVWYLDQDGALLPLFAATYSNLPVVSGFLPDTTGRLGPAALARVKRFLADCETAGAAAAKRISQVDFSAPFAVRIKLEDSPAVVEINDAKTPELLWRLQQIAQSEQNGPKGLPKRINLCYENLAYVQW
jgi:cell division protein FtsQ